MTTRREQARKKRLAALFARESEWEPIFKALPVNARGVRDLSSLTPDQKRVYQRWQQRLVRVSLPPVVSTERQDHDEGWEAIFARLPSRPPQKNHKVGCSCFGCRGKDLSSLTPKQRKGLRRWQNRKWLEANRERVKQTQASWRQNNRDKVNAIARRTYHRHRDKYVARMRSRQPKYNDIKRNWRKRRVGRVCKFCYRNDGQVTFTTNTLCTACSRQGWKHGYCCGEPMRAPRKGKPYCVAESRVILDLVREANGGGITYLTVQAVKGCSAVAAKRHMPRLRDKLRKMKIRFIYAIGGGGEVQVFPRRRGRLRVLKNKHKGTKLTEIHIDIASLKRALGEKISA